MPSDAAFYRWSELPQDHPMEKLDRRRITGEHVMLSEVFLHQGCIVPEHAHENEQFAVVVSGRLRFNLPGPDGSSQQVTVGAGEVLHLPPNAPHEAEALEDSVVLDVFSPVSETTGVDRD